MKQIIYSTCSIMLAFAVTAWGEPGKREGRGNARANVSANASPRSAAVQSNARVRSNVGPVNTRQSFSSNARIYNQPSFSNRNATVRQHATSNLDSGARITTRDRNVNNEFGPRNYVTRKRDVNVGANSNVMVNRGQNVTVNRSPRFMTNRSGVTVNNNWRGSQFSGQNYTAFRNYSRSYHDRYWYERNYPRITSYFGAPYYWNSGYWYPAWGYNPDYVYQYDGPIYGYNGLAPNEVVMQVQVGLQRAGYYAGPIDGVLGPVTREAITAFQSDNGLAITSAIDQPTLSTLGLG